MISTRRGKLSPRELRSTLVVKRTFLELEGRSVSPDSRDEDKPKSGLRFRACSDSAIYDLAGENSDKASEDGEPNPEPNTLADERELVLTGLSDDEAETESTVSVIEEQHTGSFSGVSGYGSSRSASKEGRPLRPRSRSPSDSHQVDSSEADITATTSQPRVERLTNENARLLLENMMLRQQCLEVAKVAQSIATTEKAASMYCETPEMLPTEPVQASQGPPALIFPGSAHAHGEGAQQLNLMSSGKSFQQQRPSASTTMPLGLPTMVVPGADLNAQPRSDDVFSGMPFGSYVWVPMECGMPLGAQVFPMASDNACSSRISDAHSLGSTQPSQQQSGQTMRGRRGARAARAEQMFAKHAAVAASKNAPKVQKSAAVFEDLFEDGHNDMQDSDLNRQCTCPPHLRTTVMLRNLPNNYSRVMLLDLIDSEGFEKMYDFIYLPIDFKSRASLGYAFVNLTTNAAAKRFRDTFDGFSNWILPSRKVCGVNWSGPHQGLDAHIERYRNSPVMHEAVPDIYKPALFKDGQRTTFPPPTKKLRAPRIRHFHTGGFDFRSSAPGNPVDPKLQPGLAFQQLQESHDLSGDEQYWR